MRTVFFGAVTYAFILIALSLALAGIGVFQHRATRANQSDNSLIAAYLVLAAGALSTIGFALVTASSPSWRKQTVQSVVLVSASISVLAFLLQLSGLASLPVSLLLPARLLRAWPRASAIVSFAFPGILTGIIAVFIAWGRGSRRAAA